MASCSDQMATIEEPFVKLQADLLFGYFGRIAIHELLGCNDPHGRGQILAVDKPGPTSVAARGRLHYFHSR